MRVDIEGPCGAVARADAVRQVVMMKAFMETQSAMREQTNELAAKEEIIQQLRLHIQVGTTYNRILLLKSETFTDFTTSFC